MLHARPSEQIPGGEVMGDSWEEKRQWKRKKELRVSVSVSVHELQNEPMSGLRSDGK